MERITERNFEMMSGKYQKEQIEIEARLREVTETLNESYEKSQGIRDFLSLIRNYQGIKELDATILCFRHGRSFPLGDLSESISSNSPVVCPTKYFLFLNPIIFIFTS
jgi:hypothetical protein